MNAADIVLIAFGCFFLIKGVFNGFSGEVFSLVSVVGGFWCSMTFYSAVSSALNEAVPSLGPMPCAAISMGLIFLAVYLVCFIALLAWRKLLKETGMTWGDKFCGLLVGCLKLYITALTIVIIGMLCSPLLGDGWIRDSRGLSAAAATWPYVHPALSAIGILPDIETLRAEAFGAVLRGATGVMPGGLAPGGEAGSEPRGDSEPALPTSPSLPPEAGGI